MLKPVSFLLDPVTTCHLAGGTWAGPQREVTLSGAAVDSRLVCAGSLFACFRGVQVDGHDYADAASRAGAALILASRPVAASAPVLLVPDVTQALGRLAAEYRRRYIGATWIGVTGSNGKTTVKELVRAACAATGPVHCTSGNLNNHLGVPLTILNTPAGCRFVVVEMGASGPGEIAALAAIAQPQVGCITSIGPAHLEGFGNLVGVARGKGELFAALPAGAPALLGRHNLDRLCRDTGDRFEAVMAALRQAAAGRDLRVLGEPGLPVDGTLTADGIVLRTVVGEVGLNLIGGHNLANAALAWHTAVAAGADAAAALGGMSATRAVSGRLLIRHLGEHRLLDDSYNANPASMTAGLDVLARMPGARLAVLGHMGELGPESPDLHRRVGAEAARLGLPLITVGLQAKSIGEGYTAASGRDWTHAADRGVAVEETVARLRSGAHAVLVKASRSAGLETVVKGVAEALGYAVETATHHRATGKDGAC